MGIGLELEHATFILAALGLLISGVLAWIRIREAFFQKGEFGIQADWINYHREPLLRIVVYNQGSKKDCVKDIRFRQRGMDPARGGAPFETVTLKLPLVLDVNEATPPFLLRIPTPRANTPPTREEDFFNDLMRGDAIDFVDVWNIDGKVTSFEIERQYEAKHRWLTNE